ncbi:MULTISPECIES: hypothetical protein [unclassified Arthrobacter]|nr:hypothetical protein [Arthrobacter sp. FW306-06-A]UKA71449.1 hypothetical protein LFT49_01485 [Arthrobacter sp. FW306-06-A]
MDPAQGATLNDNPERVIAPGKTLRKTAAVLLGFTAALCWWIGIAGMAATGGGGQIFLPIPVLATVGAALIAAWRPGKTNITAGLPRHKVSGGRASKPNAAVVLLGFTAALFWWVGITAVTTTGGGAQIFLVLPTVATLGTALAALYTGGGKHGSIF